MSTTPMTEAQWLAALHAEGVSTSTPYSGWATHGRDGETGRAFGPVHGVVIHHTAGSNSLALCYNGTSSLPGPLCHGHLPKSGRVNMISRLRANHAGSFAQNAHNAVLAESSVHPYPDASEPVDGNDSYYGLEIENLGDGSDVYPWEQYVAAVKWATAICRFHGWTQNSVIAHKEGTRRKIDPKGPVEQPGGNFTMTQFRADVRDALALPAGVWAGQEEDMALTEDDIAKVARAVLDADRVPAVAPPYNNTDYETNKYWSTSYGIYSAVRASREAMRRTRTIEADVVTIKEKVEALTVGGVDLDALAVKVADELYRRMQS